MKNNPMQSTPIHHDRAPLKLDEPFQLGNEIALLYLEIPHGLSESFRADGPRCVRGSMTTSRACARQQRKSLSVYLDNLASRAIAFCDV